MTVPGLGDLGWVRLIALQLRQTLRFRGMRLRFSKMYL